MVSLKKIGKKLGYGLTEHEIEKKREDELKRLRYRSEVEEERAAIAKYRAKRKRSEAVGIPKLGMSAQGFFDPFGINRAPQKRATKRTKKKKRRRAMTISY